MRRMMPVDAGNWLSIRDGFAPVLTYRAVAVLAVQLTGQR
jgi:hypothetical protein